MLIEVREFCRRVEGDLAGLIDELQELTGRYGQQERRAWERSLPKLSVMLARPQLASLHLHLGESSEMAVEYRLPASSSWCDAVLLGRGPTAPAAVIIEMKDWDTAGDRPGPRESLIEHRGSLFLHPSDQVRGYVEYCRLFHSAVLADRAAVAGCVYFTQSADLRPYRIGPHTALASGYPLFSSAAADIDGGLVPFITSRLTTPDREAARARRHPMDRCRDQVVLSARGPARCAARPSRPERRARGSDRWGQDRAAPPVGLESVPVGGSGGGVLAVGGRWRERAAGDAGAGSELNRLVQSR